MRYTYLIGLLVSLPLISFIGQKVYNYIAGNRLTERCTAENCAMPVYTPPPSEEDDFLLKGWNQIRLTKVFWQFVILFLCFGQGLMIWYSPFIQNNMPKVKRINKIVEIPYEKTKWFYQEFLGVTHHAVFMYDYHFQNYHYNFKIEAVDLNLKKTIVPLLNEEGLMKNSYANGALWVNYTFRVNSPRFKLKQFEEGMALYLKHYQKTQAKSISYYKIYVKYIEPDENWKKDILKNKINEKWQDIGKIEIKNDDFVYVWYKELLEINN